MTVREFVQTILLEAPSLDAEIYIGMDVDGMDYKNYDIKTISSLGDSGILSIYIKEDES